MDTRHRRAEVAVVGAGPSGTAAAVTLARAGVDVVVVDRATFPRDKVCGDGITTAALRELEDLGLDPGSVASWLDVDDLLVRSPSGREVHFPLPHDRGTFAAIARRRDLDAALVDLARAAGATVLEGHALRSATQDDAGATLDVEDLGELQARWVLGADGMWSPLRRSLGLSDPGYRGEWHAFRQYFTDVAPTARRELAVWFDADLLPGYAWSFPLPDGAANVGFGVLRGGSYRVGDLGALWREVLARPHIRGFLGPDARPEGPHRAWPIPARVERAVLAEGRALFVGDAAAATDPMTGEGIGQALATGRWAAEALLAHADRPEEARRAYRRRVQRDLAVDNRLAGQLSRVLAHRLGARAAVRVAGLNGWTRRHFARWLFEDYPRATVLTPHRWRPGALSGPGAYR